MRGQDERPPLFIWWDDALDVARFRASLSGRRQRVEQTAGCLWQVREADAGRQLAVGGVR